MSKLKQWAEFVLRLCSDLLSSHFFKIQNAMYSILFIYRPNLIWKIYLRNTRFANTTILFAVLGKHFIFILLIIWNTYINDLQIEVFRSFKYGDTIRYLWDSTIETIVSRSLLHVRYTLYRTKLFCTMERYFPYSHRAVLYVL